MNLNILIVFFSVDQDLFLLKGCGTNIPTTTLEATQCTHCVSDEMWLCSSKLINVY